MNSRSLNSDIKHNIVRILLVTAIILMVPLMAMQVTNEVQWDHTDFIVIGTLLIGTGLTYELVVKKVVRHQYRKVMGLALFAFMLLIWVDLAVGIFDIPGFSGS